MTVGHMMGVPIEESILQLVPAGATVLAAAAVAARAGLGNLRRRLGQRLRNEGR